MLSYCMNRRRSPFPTASSSPCRFCSRRLPWLNRGLSAVSFSDSFPSDLDTELRLARPFRSRHSPLVTRHFFTDSQKCSFLSPFPTTLTNSLQLVEKTTALSPAFATLTCFVTPNPFVCHSYKKQGGWGVPVDPISLRFRRRLANAHRHPQLQSLIRLLHISLHTPGGRYRRGNTKQKPA
jgi:hypothetical protein